MGQGSKVRFFKLAAALILGAFVSTIGLTGCGGFFSAIGTGTGNGGTGTSSFVYVTNLGGTLAEYTLSSGVLTPLSGSPITLPLAPYSIVVAPNNAFVYIGTGTGVFLYTINSDGTLTEGNGANVAYVNATNSSLIAQSMVIDSSSSWLLISYRNSTVLDAVQLTPTTGLPTGAVFTIASSFSTPSPELAISASNTQVFVALGAGGVEALTFNSSGATLPLGPWPSTGTKIAVAAAGASANGVAIDPTAKYLLIAEANTNAAGDAIAGTVRIESTTALGTDLDSEPTGIGPSAVLSDLTGAFVYIANGTDGTVSGFTLNTTTQKLTSLGDAFPTEKSPVALVEDRSKTYLMTIGNLANPNLWLYSFDTSSAGSLDVSATKTTGTVNPSAANGIAVTH